MNTKDTNQYIDRPFNIRPICFWAFFVALTIAVCLASRGAVLWVGLYFACLIGTFIGLQFLKCRDKVLIFFGTSRLNFIVTIMLCLAVALSFSFTTMAYTYQKSFAGYHNLTGTVERHNLKEDGSGWFVLTDAKFGSATVSGKVAVYINNPNTSTRSAVASTYKVTMNTQLRNAPADDYNINNGIKYTANIGKNDEVIASGEDKSPRSVILRYSQSFFNKFMSARNADLMFAMLFGDQSTLSGDLSTSFSLTGLAHVLAVSGLHVIIIAGIISALLKLCRVRRKQQLPFLVAILFAYCYLCNFRFPIIRSCIMFLVFTVRRAFLKSSDLLSSICASAILILILFPYSLLSVSFQASFACVLGIALFLLPMTNFWKKVLHVKEGGKSKAAGWIANSLAMYCTVTIVWLPLAIKYFGIISLVGVFANLLIMPLLVLAFQGCFLAFITWIVFPLLYLVNILLDAVIAVTHWMASLPFSSVKVAGGGGYWFLLYFLGLILASRFIFLRPRYKYPAAAILILIFALSVVF